MGILKYIGTGLISFSFLTGVAVTADQPLDVTIKVLESPSDAPEEVTKTIKLPPAASRKPADSSNPTRDESGETREKPGDRGRGSSDVGGGAGLSGDARSAPTDRGRGKENKDKNRGKP